MYVSKLSRGNWNGLPHGPMLVDDTIGGLLETQEGFDKQKADLVKSVLLSAAKYGVAKMPVADRLRFAYAMTRYKMSFADSAKLHEKYIRNWGGAATVWRFDAIKNGAVVASVTCSPSAKLHLKAIPSQTALKEGATYDMASIRIHVADEFGNIASYAMLPVKVKVEGAAELVGPDVIVSEGGMCGTYIRTTGENGTARVTLSADGLEPVMLEFAVV